MLYFTKTTIINDAANVCVKDGLWKADGSRGKKFVVKWSDELYVDDEHCPRLLKKTAYKAAVLASATVTLPAAQTVSATESNLFRIVLYIRLRNNNSSMYSNQWTFKGKPFVVEFKGGTSAQDLKDPIENPTTYLRSFKDFPVNLCATAQQPGKEVSQPTYATVTVPFAEVPKVVDVWSDPVVKDKSYIHYHINLFQDSSEIFLHNVTFTIGDSESPAMNVLIKAPAEFNKDNRTYYLRGTDIIPFLLRGNTRVPVASMPVTNFDCYVDVKEMTYSISFDCHGGQYSNAGKLTTTIPIEVVADVN